MQIKYFIYYQISVAKKLRPFQCHRNLVEIKYLIRTFLFKYALYISINQILILVKTNNHITYAKNKFINTNFNSFIYYH